MKDASAKVIVITGASSGIGAALAQILGAQGHRLALAARRGNELEDVARKSVKDPANAAVVVTDVTRRKEVENLRDQTLRAFDCIDVWINNAGRGITKSVLDLTDEDVDQMFLLNTKSALYGMQTVIPHFQSQGRGHLINVSSFLGRVPLASFRSAYSASKAALNSLTTNLRMDLATHYPEIHVSLVMPGMVQTEFARNALGGLPVSGPSAGTMNPQTADEVAGLIADLIESPKEELYTNPASLEILRKRCAELG